MKVALLYLCVVKSVLSQFGKTFLGWLQFIIYILFCTSKIWKHPKLKKLQNDPHPTWPSCLETFFY